MIKKSSDMLSVNSRKTLILDVSQNLYNILDQLEFKFEKNIEI